MELKYKEFRNGVNQKMLRRFGDVERMDQHRMSTRESMAEVSGERVQGKPKLGWIE